MIEFLPGLRELANLGVACSAMAPLYRRPELVKVLATRNIGLLTAKFGLERQTFEVMLRETGALVAGSFALQCLTGESYLETESGSDIDIYVRFGAPLQGVKEYLKAQGYCFAGTIEGPVSSYDMMGSAGKGPGISDVTGYGKARSYTRRE
jgi:hypothetical protein